MMLFVRPSLYAIFAAAMLFAHPLFAETLHQAAGRGASDTVERLLDQGADPGSLDDLGETPLSAAALAGQTGVVELLLERGADVNGRNVGGFTLLHAAAYRGHLEIVILALDGGAAIDDQNNKAKITPLHAAAERNHLAVAELLLRRGARLDLKELNGWTPLDRATFKRYGAMVRFLRAQGGECPSITEVGPGHSGFCNDPSG